MGTLEDYDACLAASHHPKDLCRYPNCRDEGLHHQGGPWAESLSHPAGDEQVYSTAKCGTHAQNRILRCCTRRNLVAATPVAIAQIWRVIAVEDVTNHQVENIKYPAMESQLVVLLDLEQLPNSAAGVGVWRGHTELG